MNTIQYNTICTGGSTRSIRGQYPSPTASEIYENLPASSAKSQDFFCIRGTFWRVYPAVSNTAFLDPPMGICNSRWLPWPCMHHCRFHHIRYKLLRMAYSALQLRLFALISGLSGFQYGAVAWQGASRDAISRSALVDADSAPAIVPGKTSTRPDRLLLSPPSNPLLSLW